MSRRPFVKRPYLGKSPHPFLKLITQGVSPGCGPLSILVPPCTTSTCCSTLVVPGQVPGPCAQSRAHLFYSISLSFECTFLHMDKCLMDSTIVFQHVARKSKTIYHREIEKHPCGSFRKKRNRSNQGPCNSANSESAPDNGLDSLLKQFILYTRLGLCFVDYFRQNFEMPTLPARTTTTPCAKYRSWRQKKQVML